MSTRASIPVNNRALSSDSPFGYVELNILWLCTNASCKISNTHVILAFARGSTPLYVSYRGKK